MNLESQPNKSTFVTVIAWLSILVASYGIYAYGSYVIFYLFMTNDLFNTNYTSQFSGFVKFILENNYYIVQASLLLSLTVLIISIGLLKRKNWARLLFIICLMIEILFIAGSMVFDHSFKEELNNKTTYKTESVAEIVERTIKMTDIDTKMLTAEKDAHLHSDKTSAQQRDIMAEQKSMMQVAYLIETFSYVAVILFFSWLIWKFTRPTIISEFKYAEVNQE